MCSAKIEFGGNYVGEIGDEGGNFQLHHNPETVVLYSGDGFSKSVASVYQSGRGEVARAFIPAKGDILMAQVTVFEDSELFGGPVVTEKISKNITVIRG